MKQQTWNTQLRRALSTALVLGIAVPPLTVATAKAAPPAHAPAWGYRDRDRDRDGDGINDRRDRDDDNDGVRDDRDTDYYQNGQANQATITGTVTRDLNGNRFEMRRDGNGDVFTVNITRGTESRALSVGDRVRVVGRFNQRQDFRARQVVILRDDNGNTGDQAITLYGTVTRDLSGNRFQVRDDAGYVYEVRLRKSEPSRLSAGDRVVVKGTRTAENGRRIIIADSLTLRDTNGGNGGVGGGQGARTQRTGVVRRVTGDDFDAEIGGGRVIRVVTASNAQLPRVERGDRVQFWGYFRSDDVFHADRVSNIGDASDFSERVQWTGVRVLEFDNNSPSVFFVRHEGTRYRIDARGSGINGAKTGDYVMIVGYLDRDNRLVKSNYISVQKRYDNDNDNNDRNRVDFRGTVEGVRNNRLDVRGENGRLYIVSWTNADDYRRGQKVRVYGNARNGIVYATDVDKR